MKKCLKFCSLFIGVISLFLLGVAVFMVVFVYPYNRIPNYLERELVKAQLPYAVKRWQSQGILDYDVDIHIDESDGCQADGTLQVRNDQFQAFIPIGTTEETAKCVFDYYVIPTFFDLTKNMFNFKVWPIATLTVKFNYRYGYISYFNYLLPASPGINDFDIHYIVSYSNFRILTSH